jgi:hypothetical protein
LFSIFTLARKIISERIILRGFYGASEPMFSLIAQVSCSVYV